MAEELGFPEAANFASSAYRLKSGEVARSKPWVLGPDPRKTGRRRHREKGRRQGERHSKGVHHSAS